MTAGCSGNNHSAAGSLAPPEPAPASATASVSFVVPARGSAVARRAPSTLSSATLSLVVQVSGGATVIQNVPGPGTYSISVPVPVGNAAITVFARSGPNGTGSVLNRGSASQVMTPAGPNVVNITAGGVIASASFQFTFSSGPSPQVWNVVPQFMDAASQPITGALSDAVSFTSSDSANAPLSTASITNASTPVILSYNVTGFSGNCNYAQVQMTGTGFTPVTNNFVKDNFPVTNGGDTGAMTQLRFALNNAGGGATIAIQNGVPEHLAAVPSAAK